MKGTIAVGEDVFQLSASSWLSPRRDRVGLLLKWDGMLKEYGRRVRGRTLRCGSRVTRLLFLAYA